MQRLLLSGNEWSWVSDDVSAGLENARGSKYRLAGPGRFEQLRGFGGAYEDLGVLKDIHIGRFTAQARFEIFNLFNRRYLADPVTDIASPHFRQITGTGAQTPRQGQLGLRLRW